MKRVIVTAVVEVDEQAWDLAYGTGTTSKAITDDVRTYVKGQIQDSAAAGEGGILSVTIR